MAETVEELTVNFEQDGELQVKELEKKILTRGAWATILYSFQSMDRKTGKYGKVQFTIRRYKKSKGRYIQQSKFNFSSEEQALKVADTLYEWCGKVPK